MKQLKYDILFAIGIYVIYLITDMPLIFLLAISAIIIYVINKKHDTLSNLSDEEVAQIAYKAYREHINDHYMHMYTLTRDKEYLNDITPIKEEQWDPYSKLIFHGACHDCNIPEKETVRACLSCKYYPGNWDTHKPKS